MKKNNIKSIITKICLLFTVCLLVSFNPVKAEAATVTGQDIVNEARRHLGVPYQWGGNGPNTFDCSGLTVYVYNKFGISLPRLANAQTGVGTYVAKESLQPGDLVFFGSNGYATHVGIFVGNNEYIHAPQDNEVVKISKLSVRSDYYTARRILTSTGWAEINKIFYYYSNGTMVTGWKEIGTDWYYFNGEGQMLTGWQRIGTDWYYFSKDGQMVKGWLQLDGKWYFLSDSGQMLTGTHTLAGIVYTFDQYGVWIK